MGIIVSFATEKGGSKKTTMNEITAEIFSDLGYNVCVLDCDAQQTITKWIERRNELINDVKDESIKPISLEQEFDPKMIFDTITNLKDKYDVLIIDTPGRDSDFLTETYLSADILIIPVTPVQNDLETMPSILRLLKRTALRYYDGGIIRTMLVDIPTHNKDTSKQDAIDKLTDLGLLEHAPLTKSFTRKRKVYSDAQKYGLTGYSIKNPNSNLECNALKNEMASLLEELIENYNKK